MDTAAPAKSTPAVALVWRGKYDVRWRSDKLYQRYQMCRTLLVLAVALFARYGTAPAAPDEPKVDPNATYTIKFRGPQSGEKTEQTVNTAGKSEIDFGSGSQKDKTEAKTVFTEHVVELPAGSAKPAKLTRTFTTAREYDKTAKEFKPLAYEGKTVSIEKKEAGYEFTVAGKKMDPKDATLLTHEFAHPGQYMYNDMLPKKAVKVGEMWALDLGETSPAGDSPVGFDETKSKATGKLTKVYQKDGKLWGVIAIERDMVIDSTKAKGKAKLDGTTTGILKMSGTLEGVIDGSARDLTMSFVSKTNYLYKAGGMEFKMSADLTVTVAIKTVK